MKISQIAEDILTKDEIADVDYLYHVTYLKNIPGIQERGLLPGTGQTFGGWYGGYAKDKLFLTESGGVPYWISKLEQQAEADTDNPEDGWVPVVLSFSIKDVPFDMIKDEEGTKDSGYPSWSTLSEVPREAIEAWDGSDWTNVLEIDADNMNEEAKEASEFIEEDDDAWWEMNYEVFLPPDDELVDYEE